MKQEGLSIEIRINAVEWKEWLKHMKVHYKFAWRYRRKPQI